MNQSDPIDTKLDRIPVHQQVATNLREHIRRLTPGQRLEPEVQLAKRFGVSVHTVREALTTFAHQGLLERRAGRGSFVLEQNTRQHVALILGIHPSYQRLNHFSFRLLERTVFLLSEADYGIRTYWAQYRPDSKQVDPTLTDFEDSVAAGRVRAVMIVRGPLDQRWKTALQNTRLPVVGGNTSYAVLTNRVQMIQEGVRLLTKLGRRKVALLTWKDPEPLGYRKSRVDDAAVFRQALADQGVTARDEWIRRDLYPALAGAGYEEFKEIWVADDEKPDGLLIGDDVLSVDVAQAILDIGIEVPRQLAVVTHANKGSGILYPFPAIRLEYDPDFIAGTLGQMLMRLMKGEQLEERVVCAPLRIADVDRVALKLEQADLESNPEHPQVPS